MKRGAYRTTRRPSGDRYRLRPAVFTAPRDGALFDLGATGFTSIPGHGACFRFACGCNLTVNENGEHYTSILPGCPYWHPYAWHGRH